MLLGNGVREEEGRGLYDEYWRGFEGNGADIGASWYDELGALETSDWDSFIIKLWSQLLSSISCIEREGIEELIAAGDKELLRVDPGEPEESRLG